MNPRLPLLLAAGALAIGAVPASAATSLGQVDSTSGKGAGGCGGVGCYEVQLATAPGTPSYVVPTPGGVITSWSFHAVDAPGTARLQLYAPGPGAGQFTLLAQTQPRTFALGEAATTQTQIPVPAGTHLGIDVVGPEPVFNAGNATDLWGAPTVNSPLGSISNVSPVSGLRVNIAAILEQDADRDGYGDETQDGCPTDAAQQLPCAPNTTPATQSTPATPTQAGPHVSIVTPVRESIKSGYVTVSATSVGQVTVSASGRIGAYKLVSASRSLAAGNRVTLKLKIPKKTLRAIRVRLAHHRKVSAKVTVTAGGTKTPVRIQLVR